MSRSKEPSGLFLTSVPLQHTQTSPRTTTSVNKIAPRMILSWNRKFDWSVKKTTFSLLSFSFGLRGLAELSALKAWEWTNLHWDRRRSMSLCAPQCEFDATLRRKTFSDLYFAQISRCLWVDRALNAWISIFAYFSLVLRAQTIFISNLKNDLSSQDKHTEPI